MERLYVSLLSKYEQKVIKRLVKIIPGFIRPIHLTILSIVSAFLIFLCYALANHNKFLLLIAPIFYALSWLGDSLDGALARYRKIEKEKFGYYLDHFLDSISAILIILGLYLYLNNFMWIIFLIGVLLCFIHIYLKAATLNKFEIGFKNSKLGPTELRIIGILYTVFLFFNNNLNLANLICTVGTIFLYLVLLYEVYSTLRVLIRLEN